VKHTGDQDQVCRPIKLEKVKGFGETEKLRIGACLSDTAPCLEVPNRVKITPFVDSEYCRLFLGEAFYHPLDKILPLGKVEVFLVMLQGVRIYAVRFHAVTLFETRGRLEGARFPAGDTPARIGHLDILIPRDADFYLFAHCPVSGERLKPDDPSALDCLQFAMHTVGECSGLCGRLSGEELRFHGVPTFSASLNVNDCLI
jgi:hypothetical protein